MKKVAVPYMKLYDMIRDMGYEEPSSWRGVWSGLDLAFGVFEVLLTGSVLVLQKAACVYFALAGRGAPFQAT